MNWILGIPFVNRPDLLDRALESIRDHWLWVAVLDNGLEPLELKQPIFLSRIGITLSVAQSFNWFRRLASFESCPFFLFMHSDVVAGPGTVEKLIAKVEELEAKGEKWAFLGAHYDWLCAFNCAAFDDIGPFDANLPTYYTDNDWHYRALLKGYTAEWYALRGSVRHIEESATVNSDPKRRFIHDQTIDLRKDYYLRKWGGLPREEKFTMPFNSPLFADGPGFDGQT